MRKINPFKPYSIAPTGMFAGRMKEVEALENGLQQAKYGEPINFMLIGDRGIGKSSLLLYFTKLAAGDINTVDDTKFNFIVIDTSVSESTNIQTFVKLCEKQLKRKLSKVDVLQQFMSSTWEFVQRIKIMDSGVARDEQESDQELLIDDFAYSLSETCNRVCDSSVGEEKSDGMIIVIDECDNVGEKLRLGYLLKTLSEKIQKNGCEKVFFVIAGLPNMVEILSNSHESSVRMFDQLPIKELKPLERTYVIKRGLTVGNEANGSETSISEEACSHIGVLSEGYPHFIQQFAYSAFEMNADDEITMDDVLDGAFNEGGAIDAIGSRYYASDFYDKIKSDEYRNVLQIMSESMNSWVSKGEIRKKFNGDDSTLSNALVALTTRKIILKNPSKRGEYRLQQRGFALWIKLFGSRNRDRP